jgi:hypothetical protein
MSPNTHCPSMKCPLLYFFSNFGFVNCYNYPWTTQFFTVPPYKA